MVLLDNRIYFWDLFPAAATVIAIQKGKLRFLSHIPPFSYPTEDICMEKHYPYRGANFKASATCCILLSKWKKGCILPLVPFPQVILAQSKSGNIPLHIKFMSLFTLRLLVQVPVMLRVTMCLNRPELFCISRT